MLSGPLAEKLAGFARSIGIDVRTASLPEATFLPGIDVSSGVVLIDESRLLYPGDILHEAGHIAVTDPAERNLPNLSPSDGDEMAALAWSYAAARHLGIDPEVVFHADGYRGGGANLVENFNCGRYVGVPLLQLYGMTVEPRHAAAHGVEPFPHMLRWLR
jgi:hypothetical protein